MMAEEVYLFSVGLFSLVLFVQCGIDGIEPTSWSKCIIDGLNTKVFAPSYT